MPVLNTGRDGDDVTCCGAWFHAVTTLGKKEFLNIWVLHCGTRILWVFHLVAIDGSLRMNADDTMSWLSIL